MLRSNERLKEIHTRADFVDYVRDLARAAEGGPENWANTDLGSFLEGMAAWVEDMDGYFANSGERPPEDVDWRFFGEVLAAATLYE